MTTNENESFFMNAHIGVRFKDIQELSEISSSYLKDIPFYACLSLDDIRNNLYSQVLMKDSSLPTKTAAFLDIDDLNNEVFEILAYLSLKIIIFTSKIEKSYQTASKLLKYMEKTPDIRYIYMCDTPKQFITLHILTNYSPLLTAGTNLPLNATDWKVWKSLPLSAVFLTKDHFKDKFIKEEFIPFISEANHREVPTFLTTDLPDFPFSLASVCQILEKVEPKISKYIIASPMQPLAKQLSSSVYQIFETDRVKYDLYEEAMKKVFEKKGKDAVLAVVGAGRGPLVDRALKVGFENIIVVEKNHAAAILLRQRLEKDWPKSVTFFEGDMRNMKFEKSVDVIVSELLGSFGDNELSPECLFGCNKFLSKDAVSIPTNYSSFLVPISSHHLWTLANNNNLDMMWIVSMNTSILLSDYQEVFSFSHPSENSDFYSEKILEFKINCDATLHGFGGWFDSQLFDDVKMTNSPLSGTSGMDSWYQVYAPIRKPVKVAAGEIVKLWIARKTDGSSVWYEWCLLEPEILAIQNISGCVYSIGLSSGYD